MKIWIKYNCFFAGAILLFWILMSNSKNPETLIKGEWKELVWEYEKVRTNDTLKTDFKNISDYVKEAMGEDLVIHKAEKWIFYPNGKLLLIGTKFTKKATWTIKGRGNILELKYDNNIIEDYGVTALSDDKLVLNFDSNPHVRGIARLTLKK